MLGLAASKNGETCSSGVKIGGGVKNFSRRDAAPGRAWGNSVRIGRTVKSPHSYLPAARFETESS
jgi:hypothetical protein